MNTVLLNGITVKGNVTLTGGGDQAGNPWPIKLNTIGGNLTVTGATPEWLGVLNNEIGGNVTLTFITVALGETIDVGNNTIRANLSCLDSPPPWPQVPSPARPTPSAAVQRSVRRLLDE